MGMKNINKGRKFSNYLLPNTLLFLSVKMSTKDTKATKATKAAQVIELIKYIKQERAAKKKALEELNQSQGPLKKRASEPDQKKGM